MAKVGIMGAGSWGTAISWLLTNNGHEVTVWSIDAKEVEMLDREREHKSKLPGVKLQDSIRFTNEIREGIEGKDFVVLAVPSPFTRSTAQRMCPYVKEGQILVSIAAGKTLAWLKEKFGKDQKIIRTMPNTPALVGEGITGVCPDDLVTEEEINQVLTILGSFGKAAVVTEPVLDIVGAVSGSSPAFVFMFIEAMADGAVAEGMPRKQAYEFAAQAVLGSAKMVLETGLHPGSLKDMVCSPGGTTIEGVNVLEKEGMRSAVMDAVRACIAKTRKL